MLPVNIAHEDDTTGSLNFVAVNDNPAAALLLRGLWRDICCSSAPGGVSSTAPLAFSRCSAGGGKVTTTPCPSGGRAAKPEGNVLPTLSR